MLGQTFKDTAVPVTAGLLAQRYDGALNQRLATVGYYQIRINLHMIAQAIAFRAGSLRCIE